MSTICKGCQFKKDCEYACPAYTALHKAADMQDKKDKTMYVRNLARNLDIRDVEKSDSLRRLGTKIINNFDEFSFIKEWNIKIGYVLSHANKNGEKIVYGDCRKVPEVYRAYLPYDFVITFYECNTDLLDENQKKILMLHELKHIGMGERGLKIISHEIEDFAEILLKYGYRWNEMGEEVPDIFGGDDIT